MRLASTLLAYCHALPKWNTISIAGYQCGEGLPFGVKEVGFSCQAIAYVQAAMTPG